jgi:hypothetical protein
MQHGFRAPRLAKTLSVAWDALLAELTILQLLWAVFTLWFPSSSPSFFKTLVIQQANIQSYYFRVGLGWLGLNVLSFFFILVVLQGATALINLVPSLRGNSQASSAPASSPEPATPSAKSRLRWWAAVCGYTTIYFFLSYFGAYILRDPSKPTSKGMSEVIQKTDADAKMLLRYEGGMLLALCFVVGLLGMLGVFKLVKRISDRFAGVKKPSADVEAGVQVDAKEDIEEEKAEEERLLVEVTEASANKAGIHQVQVEVLVDV